MAVSSYDPVDGHPIFLDTAAPDIKVDPTKASEYAAAVGTRLIGTTAERTAYAYAREGLEWYDTTTNSVWIHNGSGWVNRARATGQVACPAPGGGGNIHPIYWSDLIDVTFPVGLFTSAPKVLVQTMGPDDQIQLGGVAEQITTSGCKVRGIRLGSAPNALFSVTWLAVQ
jgi:hypothetical protein